MKKILAAVTALSAVFAVCGSAGAATDASIENKPTYSDVKTENEYFDTIELLTKLDIMDGYEDGRFQPDKKVTRAEFSKLIVNVLGENEQTMADEAKGHDTIFSDVKADHWASGYITAATMSSIINGMGDGTFAPEKNITYAQAMKMLVCAAGYSQWAVDRGGWPDGYMYWGNQVKIGAGVEDVLDVTEITRGQTAKMIENVLSVPLCIDTYEYVHDQYGNRYAMLEMKDGTGEDWQTFLTYRDIYEVKGYLEKENVFVITSARNFNDENYPALSSEKIDISANCEKDSLNKNAKAYIKADADGKYTLLYMLSAPSDEVAEYDRFGNRY